MQAPSRTGLDGCRLGHCGSLPGTRADFAFVTGALDHELGRVGTMKSASWQNSKVAIGLPKVRADDRRHAYCQRPRDAGISEEDGGPLRGHAMKGMPQRYSTVPVARL